MLGGGGILGEAWLSGVLAGIEDAAEIEFASCESFVGTSAGSIVAARLAAGIAPERPRSAGRDDPSIERTWAGSARLRMINPELAAGAHRLGSPLAALGSPLAALGSPLAALGSPLAAFGLTLAAPAGALARAAALRAMPRAGGSLGGLGHRIDETGVIFDGRLRVVAVSRDSGRRVMFGDAGSPVASVGQAVEASCTVPWLFAPVRIAGVDYVDGGVWSPTNLDGAPIDHGTSVLCLNPTAGLTGRHPLVAAARSMSRVAMTVEAAALRARGAAVTLVGPDRACATVIGTNLMDRGPRATVLDAAYRQGFALGTDGPAPRRSPFGA